MADQLVTLWRYRDLPEALIARAKLDSQLIWCVLADDNIVRLNWFISNAVGGVRLRVAEEDARLALELLAEEIPQSFTAEEIGEEYRQPSCTNCHSRDVSYEPVHRGLALVGLCVLSLPLWLPKGLWKCEECGHQWKAEYE
ncbi:MAG TPA: DUF2007 domain-containing protein [Candidatus Angelobacter sp.]|nr:DUF2007 domain-containing protein [Candidatus Angelobacter sp.]